MLANIIAVMKNAMVRRARRVGGAVKREELLVALSNKIREVSCRTVAAIDPHHFGRGTQ